MIRKVIVVSSFLVIVFLSFALETKSNDATLKSLSINNGWITPTFSSIVNSYSAMVQIIEPLTTTSLAIIAIPTDSRATVSSSSIRKREVGIGYTSAEIEVTAEDGSKNVYSINNILHHDTVLMNLNQRIYEKYTEAVKNKSDEEKIFNILMDDIISQPFVKFVSRGSCSIEIEYISGVTSYVSMHFKE